MKSPNSITSTLPCRSLRLCAFAVENGTRRNSGFTLIEIAVALVIFVIGALAIVRIFPPAFNLIQNSGSRTIASHLSRSTVNKFNSAPNIVPDAVYAYESGSWQDYPWAVAGNNKDVSLPAQIELYGTDTPTAALDTFRRIVGERDKVQFDVNGKPFIMTQYPYWDTANDANTASVYLEDLVYNVRIDTQGHLDFSNAILASTGQPYNDASAGPALVSRPPDSARIGGAAPATFYLTYSWVESGYLNKVYDEPLQYRPDTSLTTPSTPTQASPGPDLSGNERVLQSYRAGTSVVPGFIAVRVRTALGTLDPTVDQGMVGFLDLSTYSSKINPGTVVGVDYSVSDWRWMVDDSAVVGMPGTGTPSGYGTVNLAVRHITDEQPVWFYSMLTASNTGTQQTLTSQNSSQTNPSQYAPFHYNGSGCGVTSGACYVQTLSDTDRKNGRITYDLSYINGLNGFAPRARTTYMNYDGYAHQISVAARSYVPYYDSTAFSTTPPATANITEPWRSYVWSQTEADTLYFHPSEAGKSVMITYSFQNPNDATKTETTTSIISIDQDLVPAPAFVPATFINTSVNPQSLVAKAQLIAPNGQVLSARGILGVKGASVEARTAYVDNNRYTQAAVFGYRPTF